MNSSEKQAMLQHLVRWEESRPPPLDPTFYTSFAFLTNAFIVFCSGYTLYGLLFIILFITSILFRLYPMNAVFMIDKIAVNAVVLYGGYILYHRSLSSIGTTLIVSTFLLTVYLFYYGYLTQTYCYDKEYQTAKKYTSLLHLLSSLGHHLIVLA